MRSCPYDALLLEVWCNKPFPPLSCLWSVCCPSSRKVPKVVSVRPACYPARVPQNQNKTLRRTLLLHFCCQPCFSVTKAGSHFSVPAHRVAPGVAPASLLTLIEWLERPLCSYTGELTTVLGVDHLLCSWVTLHRHLNTSSPGTSSFNSVPASCVATFKQMKCVEVLEVSS